MPNDAVKEVARTTGKAVDAARELGGFFSSILGDGFRHLGNAFADWAAFLQYRNLLSIHAKWRVLREERGVDTEVVPLPARLAIPLIEQASREDDDSLQLMWAALLDSATKPGGTVAVRKIFIEILGSLEPIDALILKFISEPARKEEYGLLTDAHLNSEEISRRLSLDREEVSTSLQNLFRLGCLIDSWQESIESLDFGYTGFRVNNPSSNFRPSDLGRKLLILCGDA